MSFPESHPIVLYDGVCGLCNRLNQFILKRDCRDRFRFASLQSKFANDLLMRHGADPRDLDTVYVALNYGQSNERLLSRSDAILHVLTELGGIWKGARAGRWLPRGWRDWLYRVVASNRYRVFGKHESCVVPELKYRRKFLDI
ncbi:MAG: thiol-disulfide oxidoreductase DCC family protein [Pyrinomonadaceae bacterium]